MKKKEYEIKPCPFCGKIAHLENSNGSYQVVCKNLRCILGYTYMWFTSPEKALKAWNTRKER